MRIILIGPSGVGKTSIGRILAKKIQEEFYDMDFLLHNNFNYPKKDNYSKEELLEKKKLELEVFSLVLQKENFVFSTCGGLIEEQTSDNISIIRRLLLDEKNVLLLLPYENLILSKKFLMERFGVLAISRVMSLKFDRDVSMFRTISKRVFYCEKLSIEEIVEEILKIVK